MAVTLLMLRIQENNRRINDIQLKILQNSRKMQELTKFSSAAADGVITPSEIGDLGGQFFGDALEFMDNADMTASTIADQQAADYETLFGNITANDYYGNSAYMETAKLYFDADQNLDMNKTRSALYDKILADYANDVLMPALKELETELQQENDQLQTESEQISAENETLKQAKSNDIRNSAIQLS